ncbi:unnamed protein product [Adineta ricciae]|uniref:Uncharacterized protein n=1 Tax=Adineta ricciae TaxID=249248 RepID=A0A814F0H3_ADIRI|nr:unnamed protein product [Adineta ricciae]CAF0976328.1 unnamed protein product [Adineta ricciae]
MLILAFEIIICAFLIIGLIVVLMFCYNVPSKKSNDEKHEKIDFLPITANETLLVQSTLMAYYEQQRNELIERQKVIKDQSIMDITNMKINDSCYSSIPSPSDTPHSVYECSGFASMDNLEVPNPLFSTDMSNDLERQSTASFVTAK